jgi:hypothetical protein
MTETTAPAGALASGGAAGPVWQASVLREVLLASPFGQTGVGRAVVGLLDGAGLLARPDVVEALLVVECDDAETPVFADVDLYAVSLAARGDHHQVDLDDPGDEPVRRLLGVVVLLVDLDAELAELDPATRVVAVTALARFLAVFGPNAGLTISTSPAADTAAASPIPATAGGTR